MLNLVYTKYVAFNSAGTRSTEQCQSILKQVVSAIYPFRAQQILFSSVQDTDGRVA